MKALRFRVRNYRNIDDSGWVPLDCVTAFVGRNESGKTSLLRALNKFNSGTAERYDAQREFPRDRYMRDYVLPGSTGAEWPVCSIEFEIAAGLKADIATILGRDRNLPETVTVTRHYDGSLACSYAPAIRDQPLRPEPLLGLLRELASPAGGDTATGSSSRMADWAREWHDRLQEIDDVRREPGRGLLQSLERDVEDHIDPATEVLLVGLAATVGLMLEAPFGSRVADHVDALVERHLPGLIYFENYGVLDSAIWLPEFLEGLRRESPEPRIRTANALFRHAGLDPGEIAELGKRQEVTTDEAGQRRMEERAIRLNAASVDISRRCAGMWSQRRHRIRYHADGDHFRIWVSDDILEDVEIELESRGKGFQWFFSFFLVFLVESEAGMGDAILLLDEPGLSLHPTAQQELLAFFDHLSRRNQVIYTTHSPFLIDSKHLDRVRPVYEDETGHARILRGAWPPHRETLFALKAAAGHAMFDGLIEYSRTLLVENVSDVCYLQVLSQQCSATGRTALCDTVRIVPCGGAAACGYLASLLMAEDRHPVILFDGSDVGRVRRNALVMELVDRQDPAIVLLDEALNWSGHDMRLEDLFGDHVILEGLESATGLSLSPEAPDHRNASLVQRIEIAAEEADVELPASWRLSTALSLISAWAFRNTNLPDDVLDAASLLFEALAGRREETPDPSDDTGEGDEPGR